ncbi:MAG: sugar nucleotide-binding protein [Kiritimatiellae bacterium]|nr:sugar nucleotide-binding protein [Kiritimatiellia bacterium]
MKVLIVGASSFIGLRLFRHFLADARYGVAGTYYEHRKDEWLQHLDITDPVEMEQVLQMVQPDVVVWVAGTKNLKKCEAEPEYARKINTTPVEDLVRILPQHAMKPHVVFISTDYVFDGERGRYSDMDVPDPKTNYGKSNLLGELILQQSPLDFSIVRTSAVMGRHGTFFEWVTTAMRQAKAVDLYDDVYFSPTPVTWLLKGLESIVQHRSRGIFHVCGNQRMSRYEFAAALQQRHPGLFVAPLVPTHADASQPLFQKDLSMIPSAVCQPFQTQGSIEELDGEI